MAPALSLPSRRAIIGALALTPTIAVAAPCPPTKILFVCPAGTMKSPIARDLLRRRAAAAGLRLDVTARGVAPADHVSPALAANLRADGLEPAPEPVLALSAADVAWADVIVAFDEAAAAPLLSRARSWRTPSWNADYAVAKADLSRRVDALLPELAERARGCR